MEAGAIAFECRQKRLHVNADWIILEPVGETYQLVPPGQPSHTVLVTNLANRVQPIIRYDLGDSVTVVPERCPCGSPLTIIRVEGRTDEIPGFPLANGQTIHLLPLALSTVVEETLSVRRVAVGRAWPAHLPGRSRASNGHHRAPASHRCATSATASSVTSGANGRWKRNLDRVSHRNLA